MFFGKKAKLLKQAENDLLYTQTTLLETSQQLAQCNEQQAALRNRFAPVLNLDAELIQLRKQIQADQDALIAVNERYQQAIQVHAALDKEVNLYQESLEIGSFGLYQPIYDFETSEEFKIALERNIEAQKQMIKADQAAICTTEWEVGGSKAEGKRMTNQYKKLMLFAFNGECDGLMAKVKWNNVTKMRERIHKSFESINKLGVTQRVFLTEGFLQLKLAELALTYEQEQKKYDEKEEQRRIREQMRDEEKAQKEIERAQKDAEDEERRFQKALDKAKQELGSSTQANMDMLNEQVQQLEEKLKEAHEKKERAIALAQLTKVGHIYVISNLGSFGENVYKIGMTRRLDPHDRVRELGDASVPFQFDIHAIIYSDNAPQLEYELHQRFKDRRLNRVNHKKEFFRVTLHEIEAFVNQHRNAAIAFTQLAEAREYRETMTLLEQLQKISTPVPEENKFPKSLL